MGMDLILYRYKGKTDKGYLDYESPKEISYNTNRMYIRHRFVEEVDWECIDSGIYGDLDYLMRPNDFKQAYEWVETLDDDSEKEYCRSFLDLMHNDETLYAQANY